MFTANTRAMPPSTANWSTTAAPTEQLLLLDGVNSSLERNVSWNSESWNGEWPEPLISACLGLVVAITVVGNTLVIAAVVTTRSLRTVTNCFVTSLALADWMVAVFVMPPAIALRHTGSWVLGRVLCDVWVSLDVLLCTASILSLCAISVDRYLAVTQPLLYSRRRRSKRLALLMILVVWLAAAAITCPPMFGWNEVGSDMDPKECGYSRNQAYVVFSAMGSFFLPLAVMLYVYARIACVIARRHDPLNAAAAGNPQPGSGEAGFAMLPCCAAARRCECEPSSEAASEAMQVRSEAMVRHEGRGGRSCSLPMSHSFRGRHFVANGVHRSGEFSGAPRVSSFRRERKTAQTLSVVVGGFVACWLPFFVLYLARAFTDPGTTEALDGLTPWFTWLGWINSAINPFIYAFYSPDFRLAFWRLTCLRCQRALQRRSGAGVMGSALVAGGMATALAPPPSRSNSQAGSTRKKITLP